MVGDLFLVLAHPPVELVRQGVDRRVHVLILGQRVDGLAAQMQCRLGLAPEFLDGQHAMCVDDLIKVTHDALNFLLHIATQGGGDFYVMSAEAQLHGRLLVVVVVLDREIRSMGHLPGWRLRSFEGARPIVSRYFATVRRATGIPSPERISASRLSLKGLAGSSSRMSLRILARIAVEEVPEPSAPSTWLEKKKRNSNTPRGVCMYLPEVTRETVDSCIVIAS